MSNVAHGYEGHEESEYCWRCIRDQRDALSAEVQKLKEELEQYKKWQEKVEGPGTNDTTDNRRLRIAGLERENINLETKYDHLRSLAQGMAETLKSISKNSCCSPCREAGLWADNALAAWDAFDKGQGK